MVFFRPFGPLREVELSFAAEVNRVSFVGGKLLFIG